MTSVREMPNRPSASCARQAMSWTWAYNPRATEPGCDGCGWGFVSDLEVVKLRLLRHHDFHHGKRAQGLTIAQGGNGAFSTKDTMLNHDFVTMLKSKLDGGRELRGILHQRDAIARAVHNRLDEALGAHDLDDLVNRRHIGASEGDTRCNGQTCATIQAALERSLSIAIPLAREFDPV